MTFICELNFVSFLDDISRITRSRYEPTSDDVVRARLRTMGVQEYRFVSEKMEKENIAAGLLSYGTKKAPSNGDPIKRHGPLGMEPGREWVIYDVGGARNNVSVSALLSFFYRKLTIPTTLETSMVTIFYCAERDHLPRTHILL